MEPRETEKNRQIGPDLDPALRRGVEAMRDAITPALRLLINVLSFIGLVWMGVIGYWWWTHSGPFVGLFTFFRGYNPMGPIGLLVILGFAILGGLGWGIWRLFLRK